MTMQFTEPSSTNGGEPTELLRLLAYEYLVELQRVGFAQFIETVGTDGQPVLIVVLPHMKLEEGKIVELLAQEIPEETPANKEGEPDAEEKKD